MTYNVFGGTLNLAQLSFTFPTDYVIVRYPGVVFTLLYEGAYACVQGVYPKGGWESNLPHF